jgi:hypothetical protein
MFTMTTSAAALEDTSVSLGSYQEYYKDLPAQFAIPSEVRIGGSCNSNNSFLREMPSFYGRASAKFGRDGSHQIVEIHHDDDCPHPTLVEPHKRERRKVRINKQENQVHREDLMVSPSADTTEATTVSVSPSSASIAGMDDPPVLGLSSAAVSSSTPQSPPTKLSPRRLSISTPPPYALPLLLSPSVISVGSSSLDDSHKPKLLSDHIQGTFDTETPLRAFCLDPLLVLCMRPISHAYA